MRRSLLLLLAFVSVLLLMGLKCLTPAPSFVTEAWMQQRAAEYLAFATTQQSDSIVNAIAHMERDLRDPGYTAPVGAIDVDAWSGSFHKFETLLDTRDFDMLYLINAYLGYEGHPYVTPAMWDKAKTAILSFKYWWTPDPTPAMPDPDDPLRDWDESFYWTENHQILFHTLEYLAGQRFPGECFWIHGLGVPADPVACNGPGEMLGAAHRDRARGFIERWMNARWELGFSEWHSNIYMEEDINALLTLAEFADDPEVATRASMLLDVLLFDLALQTRKTTLGVTHGRTEMKDKHRGPANDTWGAALFLFEQQSDLGYTSTSDADATFFSRSQRYRMPQLFHEVANDPGPFVDRQRMSVAIDEAGPVVANPPHPPGHSFDNTEENFTFWWGVAAWTVWQVVPMTVLTADAYNLWPMPLLADFQVLRDLLGDPPDLALGQNLAALLWPAASVGLLSEVDTYTYRTPDYVLSTAQSHRKGTNSGQNHAWQVTFDPDALVFTTHPMNPRQPPAEWLGTTDGQPGYWTGSASLPRSAQHENVGIHIYSPLYGDGGVFGLFDYEAMTHAYFPQDHFDQVEKIGSWAFGRKGDGYVALYSWRATQWESYTQQELDLLPPSANGPITSSFDLVAPGGASNVWIVECGRAADWGDFEAFRDAVLGASVSVTPSAGTVAGVQVFDVVYDSPSQGLLTFGWNAPFTVEGNPVALNGYPRIDNPWVTAQRGDPSWDIRRGTLRVFLDWPTGLRLVTRTGE